MSVNMRELFGIFKFNMFLKEKYGGIILKALSTHVIELPLTLLLSGVELYASLFIMEIRFSLCLHAGGSVYIHNLLYKY